MANPWAWSVNLDETNANSDQDINWAEQQACSTVNDSSRNQMASHARFYLATFGGLTTTGGALSYALTTGLQNPNVTYRDGLLFSFKAHITSGDDPTFNIDGQGPKKLYNPDLTQVKAGTILINRHYEVKYDTSLDTGNGGFVLFGLGPNLGGDLEFSGTPIFKAGYRYGANGEAVVTYSPNQSNLNLAATATSHNVQFNGVTAAIVEPAGTTMAGAQTTVTREKGDGRYGQLGAANTWVGIQQFDAKLSVGTSSASTIDLNRTTGPAYIVNPGNSGIIFSLNGSVSARVYPQGLSASDPLTVITREKGDARYAQISTSSDMNETNYPIGTVLVAQGGSIANRNASRGIRLATTSNAYFVDSTGPSPGSALSGTWRAIGTTYSNNMIYRRVA